MSKYNAAQLPMTGQFIPFKLVVTFKGCVLRLLHWKSATRTDVVDYVVDLTQKYFTRLKGTGTIWNWFYFPGMRLNAKLVMLCICFGSK